MSEDGKYISLTNLKPKITNEYVLESDPKEVLKKQQEYKISQEKMRESEENRKLGENSDDDEDSSDIDSDEYELDPSSASFDVDDIQGILYGGTSSRFWMLRKHLCSLNLQEHRDGKRIPFYSWNCLTLLMKHRDVDLVIPNEKHMDRFLKFLIFNMNTVDGNKNSA